MITNNKEFKRNAEIIITNKEKEDFNIKYKFIKNKNIIIGIGGSGPTVKWPIENWITLIDYLNKNFTTNFIIAGGKNEEVEFNLIKEKLRIDNIFSLCNLNGSSSADTLGNMAGAKTAKAVAAEALNPLLTGSSVIKAREGAQN